MKTLICIAAVLVASHAAIAEDVVVIWIPQTQFTNSLTARQTVLVELWGKSESAADKAWADSGWFAGTDTNGATGMVYVVTMRQTGRRATAGRAAQWKKALASYGVRMWTGLGTYLDAGIEPVVPVDERRQ